MRLILLISSFFLANQLNAQSKNKMDSMFLSFMDSLDKQIQLKVNTKMLDFRAKSIYGKTYSNESLLGKVTFITFWFAECAPCITEFDAIKKLFLKLKKNKKFQILTFTYEPNIKICEFIKNYKLPYEILQISQKECYRLNYNTGFPFTLIIDVEGKVQLAERGSSMDKEKVTQHFQNIYLPKIEKLLLEN